MLFDGTLEAQIPADLDDQFNKLNLVSLESFQIELQSAVIFATVEHAGCLIRYCSRSPQGEPMILVEGPGELRLVFFPQG